MGREIEIKLRVPSGDGARAMLERAGFAPHRAREREVNIVFDGPGARLIERGTLLRLRRWGAATTLTYKGPAEAGKHKSREEVELHVDDGAALETVFARLGFEPVFRYEKFRAEYSIPGEDGVATIDETPIGYFVELEGAPAWIDATARRLGFDESAYVTQSYGALYARYRESHPEAPPDMLFPAPAAAPK